MGLPVQLFDPVGKGYKRNMKAINQGLKVMSSETSHPLSFNKGLSCCSNIEYTKQYDTVQSKVRKESELTGKKNWVPSGNA